MRNLSITIQGEKLTFWVPDNTEEARVAFQKIGAIGVMGLDIETVKHTVTAHVKAPQPGLCPHLSEIRLIQIWTGSVGYIFDLAVVSKELLRQELVKHAYIAHYGIFEIKHLRKLLGTDLHISCSMMMYQMYCHATTTDEKKASLEAAIADLFGVYLDKKEQTSGWTGKLTDNQLLYAGLDSWATWKIGQELLLKIENSLAHYKLLCAMQYVVADMELNGVGFDWEAHAKLIKEWEIEHDGSEAICSGLFRRPGDGRGGSLFRDAGGGVNLGSSKQLGEWVEGSTSGATKKAWPRTPKGGYSFNASDLTVFAATSEGESVRRELEAFSKYKEADKLLSTYGEGLALCRHVRTGRLHPSYKLGFTRTGRLSCYSPNLQNIPRESGLREVFAPDIGKSIVVADFSQIEMRVAGELSGDVTMRRSFATGIDLHTLIASKITGKSMEAITPEERRLGKAVNFGLAFGMGAKALAEYATVNYGVTLTVDKAEQAVKKYRSLYREYSEWCTRQRDLADRTGKVSTILGKERCVGENGYTVSVNTPVQGSAAEVLMLSMVMLRALLRKEKVDGAIKIVGTVHDEIILECDTDRVADAKWVLKEAMNSGMLYMFNRHNGKGLVNVGEGRSWGDAK